MFSEQQPAPSRPVGTDELGSRLWCFRGQIEPDQGVRRILINKSPFRIGRRMDLALSINSNCISKEHAELQIIDDQLWIVDLGSTNGTFVNGTRLAEPMRLNEGDLVQIAAIVFRVSRESQAVEAHTLHESACDRALTMMQFDRLINDGGMTPFFQPIVAMDDRRTVGFEVLGRSRLFGLRTPAEMFAAASELNVEVELSELLRADGARLGQACPPHIDIYLNTHPAELARDRLQASLRSLREQNPDRSFVLEIHEAAITDPLAICQLKKCLDDLEIKLAFDDFGVGRSRLAELSEVRPDVVKFDMTLTREIHRAPPRRQEAVSLIVKVVNDLGIISLAEGVESRLSHEVLQQMNFKLGQGFYYGRPSPIDDYSFDDPARRTSGGRS